MSNNSTTVEISGRTGPAKGSGATGMNVPSTSSRRKQRKKQENSFVGNTKKMNGYVYETFYECKDETHFRKTTEMLGQYINKVLKFPDDMQCIYANMEEPVITVEEVRDICDKEIRAEAIK